jgi:hypothetical protein
MARTTDLERSQIKIFTYSHLIVSADRNLALVSGMQPGTPGTAPSPYMLIPEVPLTFKKVNFPAIRSCWNSSLEMGNAASLDTNLVFVQCERACYSGGDTVRGVACVNIVKEIKCSKIELKVALICEATLTDGPS